MEKIDLILYIMAGIFALNIITAIVRAYIGHFVRGDRLHANIRKYINQGQFVEAIELCESHLEKRPFDSQLLWFEAEAYFRHGNYSRALEKFKNIVNHEPSWADDAKKYIEAIDSKT
ncbi:hypothetical protein G8770_22865 [Aestuariicella hydrocarbonica]|uniref:Tetratricopeptide repeat protein n=1 Tax=Pseudomaricurvus hydrocarbonicus TaxID=1470433 RepID=A0A9E5MQ74_9GAMM|nr:hypothetical protein [Aestuariicella hydrocarbonica]NHO68405.1 hypothetical protein [Aestuariicella hydrocarbonica]